MEQKLNNGMTFHHISQAADEIVHYIESRRSGKIKSLKTRWSKFNNTCMGGIEPNAIYTMAGISGSGKSSFVNSLETDLFDLNPDVDFVVLSFNFEMLSSRQVGRKLSSKLNKTTQELYAGNLSTRLSTTELNLVKEEAEKMKKYAIYYIDMPGTVEEIKNTILSFQKTIAKNKWLVVMLDHTLLTKGKGGDKERDTLGDLQHLFMWIKKIGKTSIIQISQMNRGIEEKERVLNQSMQYPMRSDIFGGDSVYQASDYVIILHRPETLGIFYYGLDGIPSENKVFMHIIKNREGVLKVLQFENHLKYNRIEEPPKGDPARPTLELKTS